MGGPLPPHTHTIPQLDGNSSLLSESIISDGQSSDSNSNPDLDQDYQEIRRVIPVLCSPSLFSDSDPPPWYDEYTPNNNNR